MDKKIYLNEANYNTNTKFAVVQRALNNRYVLDGKSMTLLEALEQGKFAGKARFIQPTRTGKTKILIILFRSFDTGYRDAIDIPQVLYDSLYTLTQEYDFTAESGERIYFFDDKQQAKKPDSENYKIGQVWAAGSDLFTFIKHVKGKGGTINMRQYFSDRKYSDMLDLKVDDLFGAINKATLVGELQIGQIYKDIHISETIKINSIEYEGHGKVKYTAKYSSGDKTERASVAIMDMVESIWRRKTYALQNDESEQPDIEEFKVGQIYRSKPNANIISVVTEVTSMEVKFRNQIGDKGNEPASLLLPDAVRFAQNAELIGTLAVNQKYIRPNTGLISTITEIDYKDGTLYYDTGTSGGLITLSSAAERIHQQEWVLLDKNKQKQPDSDKYDKGQIWVKKDENGLWIAIMGESRAKDDAIIYTTNSSNPDGKGGFRDRKTKNIDPPLLLDEYEFRGDLKKGQRYTVTGINATAIILDVDYEEDKVRYKLDYGTDAPATNVTQSIHFVAQRIVLRFFVLTENPKEQPDDQKYEKGQIWYNAFDGTYVLTQAKDNHTKFVIRSGDTDGSGEAYDTKQQLEDFELKGQLKVGQKYRDKTYDDDDATISIDKIDYKSNEITYTLIFDDGDSSSGRGQEIQVFAQRITLGELVLIENDDQKKPDSQKYKQGQIWSKIVSDTNRMIATIYSDNSEKIDFYTSIKMSINPDKPYIESKTNTQTPEDAFNGFTLTGELKAGQKYMMDTNDSVFNIVEINYEKNEVKFNITNGNVTSSNTIMTLHLMSQGIVDGKYTLKNDDQKKPDSDKPLAEGDIYQVDDILYYINGFNVEHEVISSTVSGTNQRFYLKDIASITKGKKIGNLAIGSKWVHNSDEVTILKKDEQTVKLFKDRLIEYVFEKSKGVTRRLTVAEILDSIRLKRLAPLNEKPKIKFVKFQIKQVEGDEKLNGAEATSWRGFQALLKKAGSPEEGDAMSYYKTYLVLTDETGEVHELGKIHLNRTYKGENRWSQNGYFDPDTENIWEAMPYYMTNDKAKRAELIRKYDFSPDGEESKKPKIKNDSLHVALMNDQNITLEMLPADLARDIKEYDEIEKAIKRSVEEGESDELAQWVIPSGYTDSLESAAVRALLKALFNADPNKTGDPQDWLKERKVFAKAEKNLFGISTYHLYGVEDMKRKEYTVGERGYECTKAPNVKDFPTDYMPPILSSDNNSTLQLQGIDDVLTLKVWAFIENIEMPEPTPSVPGPIEEDQEEVEPDEILFSGEDMSKLVKYESTIESGGEKIIEFFDTWGFVESGKPDTYVTYIHVNFKDEFLAAFKRENIGSFANLTGDTGTDKTDYKIYVELLKLKIEG